MTSNINIILQLLYRLTSATITPREASMATRPCLISASRHLLMSPGEAPSANSRGSKTCAARAQPRVFFSLLFDKRVNGQKVIIIIRLFVSPSSPPRRHKITSTQIVRVGELLYKYTTPIFARAEMNCCLGRGVS